MTMNVPGPNDEATGRTTKLSWWKAGFVLFLLFLCEAWNVLLTFDIIPKFEQIYRDALPGRPLPASTLFIIDQRIPLALLTLGLIIACTIVVLKKHQAVTLLLRLTVAWFVLQTAVTIYALIIPMIGMAGGLSDVASWRQLTRISYSVFG